MKIAGLVDALNLLTDLPFTEWAWSEAPADGYGVVTADGQSELKADSDPAAEKMLTGYVDVFIKATDPDPTEDVEDAMRAIGVWFRMESIQLEPETGFIHIEWRYTDTMNKAKEAILNTLPMLLHVTSAEWDDGDFLVTFAETPGEIYEAVGTRPVGFYVPIESEEGGLIKTIYYYMTLAEYQNVTDGMKSAVFKGFVDDRNRYLEIEVLTSASEYSAEGWLKTPDVVFTYDNDVITDTQFTYYNLMTWFEERKPVYIYFDRRADQKNILMLTNLSTWVDSGVTYYGAVFLGASNAEIWEYSATSPTDILREV